MHFVFEPWCLLLQASFLKKKLNINNKRVDLSIWDTAGQEKFHALGPIYYRMSNGAILVYDITSMDTFKKVGLTLLLPCNLLQYFIMLIGEGLGQRAQEDVGQRCMSGYCRKQSRSWKRQKRDDWGSPRVSTKLSLQAYCIVWMFTTLCLKILTFSEVLKFSLNNSTWIFLQIFLYSSHSFLAVRLIPFNIHIQINTKHDFFLKSTDFLVKYKWRAVPIKPQFLANNLLVVIE